MVMNYSKQKFKVNHQWVPKIEWKLETNGQTNRWKDRRIDKRMEAITLPPMLMQSVITANIYMYIMYNTSNWPMKD